MYLRQCFKGLVSQELYKEFEHLVNERTNKQTLTRAEQLKIELKTLEELYLKSIEDYTNDEFPIQKNEAFMQQKNAIEAAITDYVWLLDDPKISTDDTRELPKETYGEEKIKMPQHVLNYRIPQQTENTGQLCLLSDEDRSNIEKAYKKDYGTYLKTMAEVWGKYDKSMKLFMFNYYRGIGLTPDDYQNLLRNSLHQTAMLEMERDINRDIHSPKPSLDPLKSSIDKLDEVQQHVIKQDPTFSFMEHRLTTLNNLYNKTGKKFDLSPLVVDAGLMSDDYFDEFVNFVNQEYSKDKLAKYDDVWKLREGFVNELKMGKSKKTVMYRAMALTDSASQSISQDGLNPNIIRRRKDLDNVEAFYHGKHESNLNTITGETPICTNLYMRFITGKRRMIHQNRAKYLGNRKQVMKKHLSKVSTLKTEIEKQIIDSQRSPLPDKINQIHAKLYDEKSQDNFSELELLELVRKMLLKAKVNEDDNSSEIAILTEYETKLKQVEAQLKQYGGENKEVYSKIVQEADTDLNTYDTPPDHQQLFSDRDRLDKVNSLLQLAKDQRKLAFTQEGAKSKNFLKYKRFVKGLTEEKKSLETKINKDVNLLLAAKAKLKELGIHKDDINLLSNIELTEEMAKILNEYGVTDKDNKPFVAMKAGGDKYTPQEIRDAVNKVYGEIKWMDGDYGDPLIYADDPTQSFGNTDIAEYISMEYDDPEKGIVTYVFKIDFADPLQCCNYLNFCNVGNIGEHLLSREVEQMSLGCVQGKDIILLKASQLSQTDIVEFAKQNHKEQQEVYSKTHKICRFDTAEHLFELKDILMHRIDKAINLGQYDEAQKDIQRLRMLAKDFSAIRDTIPRTKNRDILVYKCARLGEDLVKVADFYDHAIDTGKALITDKDMRFNYDIRYQRNISMDKIIGNNLYASKSQNLVGAKKEVEKATKAIEKSFSKANKTKRHTYKRIITISGTDDKSGVAKKQVIEARFVRDKNTDKIKLYIRQDKQPCQMAIEFKTLEKANQFLLSYYDKQAASYQGNIKVKTLLSSKVSHEKSHVSIIMNGLNSEIKENIFENRIKSAREATPIPVDFVMNVKGARNSYSLNSHYNLNIRLDKPIDEGASSISKDTVYLFHDQNEWRYLIHDSVYGPQEGKVSELGLDPNITKKLPVKPDMENINLESDQQTQILKAINESAKLKMQLGYKIQLHENEPSDDVITERNNTFHVYYHNKEWHYAISDQTYGRSQGKLSELGIDASTLKKLPKQPDSSNINIDVKYQDKLLQELHKKAPVTVNVKMNFSIQKEHYLINIEINGNKETHQVKPEDLDRTLEEIKTNIEAKMKKLDKSVSIKYKTNNAKLGQLNNDILTSVKNPVRILKGQYSKSEPWFTRKRERKSIFGRGNNKMMPSSQQTKHKVTKTHVKESQANDDLTQTIDQKQDPSQKQIR